jgi:uncharacterized protein YaiI (UPF0178 family)
MQIWVDADACPKVIKETLFRAADRVNMALVLVANAPLRVPASPNIRALQVPQGFDVADDYIVDHAEPGDLVITADIPLADAIVTKGAVALNPRGELYTVDNIRQRLAVRDMMEDLRSTGTISGGPPPLSKSERQAFANQLDRWLARAK